MLILLVAGPRESKEVVAQRHACRCATIAWVVLCLASNPPEVAAQPHHPDRREGATEDEFVINKKTVTLARSRRFESVTIYKEGTDGMRVIAQPSRAPPLTIPERIGRVVVVPSLEQYGVLLVRLAPGAQRDALDRELDLYNRQVQPATGNHRAFSGGEPEGNPIYASGSVDYLLVNEVAVRFRSGMDPRAIAEFFKQRNAKILREPTATGQDTYLVQFPAESGQSVRALSNRLDGEDQVIYAEPNFIGIDHEQLPGAGQTGGAECLLKCPDAAPATTGADPFFDRQWHLNNRGDTGQLFADINAMNAWAVTQGKPTIAIAILDDWIEADHEDLKGRIQDEWNAFALDGSFAGLEMAETDAHGTAAAGLAAAVAGNAFGVKGIAPEVKIMPVRTHTHAIWPKDVIERGIRQATLHAHVLSMSWVLGAPEHAGLFTGIVSAIENALAKGKVLVFSSGKDQGLPVAFPASLAAEFPSIIAVTATNASDALKKIGNPPAECDWGTPQGLDTVAAPGVDLYTTDRTGEAGYCRTGAHSNYTMFSGTSAAVPLVAGTAALMLSTNPELTPLQIKERLQQTAKHPHPNRRPDDTLDPDPNIASGWGLGWGRIDACRAIAAPQNCLRLSARPSRPFGLSVQ